VSDELGAVYLENGVNRFILISRSFVETDRLIIEEFAVTVRFYQNL